MARVYAVLAVELGLVFGVVAIFCFIEDVRDWLAERERHWIPILIVSIFLYLIGCFISCGCVHWMMRSPGRYITALIIILGLGGLLGLVAAFHAPMVVAISILASMVAFLLLALVVFILPCNLGPCTMALIMLYIVDVIFTVMAVVMIPAGDAEWLPLILCCVAVMVFGVLVILGTQQLMSGRTYNLTPGMYVFGATVLFVEMLLISRCFPKKSNVRTDR